MYAQLAIRCWAASKPDLRYENKIAKRAVNDLRVCLRLLYVYAILPLLRLLPEEEMKKKNFFFKIREMIFASSLI